jgi:hypothetical protein
MAEKSEERWKIFSLPCQCQRVAGFKKEMRSDMARLDRRLMRLEASRA